MERPWLSHYEKGVPVEIEAPDHTVVHNLVAAGEKYPSHAALIFGNVVEPLHEALLDRTIDYRTLLDLTYRFAAGLQKMGVERGDRVAIHLPNCPQFVIAYYATLMVGGIAVPCNPQYVARELAHQINDSGARVIVTLSLTYPVVRQIRADTPLKQVIVANIKEYFPGLLRTLFTLAMEKKAGHYQDISGDADTIWFQDVLAQAPARPTPVPLHTEDTAVLMYTGGTTGISKGAQLTHRNILANALQVRAWLPRLQEGQEIILTSLPLFHSYGMTTCMNLAILTTSAMILIPNPRVLVHILKSISKHRPSLYPGVPALYVSINNYPEIHKFDLSSIDACISGAAPLPVEVQRRFQELTHGTLVEGYGLSEATPVTHANPIRGENRLGTIGLPFPSTDAKVVDAETGARGLSPGEVGELVVRGPQVMKGYWEMPTETANVLRDGWLYTGDLARMDSDGYFQIVDRKKDMILGAGGLNIYPREVEEVLFQHPKVKNCAVVGLPVSIERGERVKAYVVLKEGEQATADDLIAFCRQNLASFKVPRSIEFRDELPMTMVGKVLRRVLLEEERQRAATLQ
ncbi:MAG: long-chain fatty acid--CoA ligase [Anaerolineales bacterium]|nr:long-chain fatty acid--CoA ligase [Anaerolineales bacterium]